MLGLGAVAKGSPPAWRERAGGRQFRDKGGISEDLEAMQELRPKGGKGTGVGEERSVGGGHPRQRESEQVETRGVITARH